MSESSPAVFQGTIGAVRTIPSRGVVSVTVECKIEDHSLVAAVAQHGKWVAVALLKEQPAAVEPKPKPRNRDAQRAAMLCDDPRFHAFLFEKHDIEKCGGDHFESINIDAAADFIRDYCGVDSRKELSSDNQNWNALQAQFDMWCIS